MSTGRRACRTPLSSMGYAHNELMQPAEASLKGRAILAGGLLLMIRLVAARRRGRRKRRILSREGW
jgi:hypothetical protein